MLAPAVAAGATAPPLMASARSVWPRVSGPDLARAGSRHERPDRGPRGRRSRRRRSACRRPLLARAPPSPSSGAGPSSEPWSWRGSGGRAHSASTAPRQSARGAASPGLRTMVAAGLPLGVALGALEVGAPALAGAAGSPSLAAVPLAAFAAGKRGRLPLGGSERARRHAAAALRRRNRRDGGGPARRAGRVGGGAGRVLVLAGVGFALVNVGALELLDEVVPARTGVEALTWLTSAEGVGLAGGRRGRRGAGGPGARRGPLPWSRSRRSRWPGSPCPAAKTLRAGVP